MPRFIVLVKTNAENLLRIALQGAITHSAVPSSYSTTWDGKSQLSMGRGGIVYNVKIGDPCHGWALGDSLEPGVSSDGVGTDREKGGYRNLSSIGNKVKVISGEAKGEWGTVVGKVGRVPGGGRHIILHFTDETLEKLTIGDKVQIRANGIGLKLVDYTEVNVVSCSPELLESWGVNDQDGKLNVPVTRVVPADYVGGGAGSSPPQTNSWDIQTQSPDAKAFCEGMKYGDIVLLENTMSIYGQGYHKGAVTVGIVITGPSSRMGNGISVTPLLCSKNGEIVPTLDPNANLREILELED